MSSNKYILSRDEILRGFKSFDKVYRESTKFKGSAVLVYASKTKGIGNTPLEAGFSISKKKLNTHISVTEYGGC